MNIFYHYNPALYLNPKLHNLIWQTTLGLSRSHFDGVCLDGSSSSTTISSSTNAVDTDAGTDVACNSKCNADSSCTAFAFLYLPQTCILYSGGPYTSGDGASAKRCFQRETGNTIYAVNPAIKEILFILWLNIDHKWIYYYCSDDHQDNHRSTSHCRRNR